MKRRPASAIKSLLLFLFTLASIQAVSQSNIIHPTEKIRLIEGKIRQDVRVYVYNTHELPRRDSTQFFGWIAGPANYDGLSKFQPVGRDSLVLELMVEHYFWYDQFRNRILGYRYVPFDDYPSELSRGEVKAIIRRLDRLEKKP